MAEIKSTMEMVLARAERMAARAGDAPKNDPAQWEQTGMRLAARYMEDNLSDLSEELKNQAPQEQMGVRKGMALTLLRNIVLPRDEHLLASSKKAITGLIQLEQASRETRTVCEELRQIIDQYQQHKDEVKQQLENSVRGQFDKKMANYPELAHQKGIDPTMLPQFREEWARIQADLNEQYTNALDQRKELLISRFESSC